MQVTSLSCCIRRDKRVISGVMPLSHKKLSAWYHQLAQGLESGLPFMDALRLTSGLGAPNAGIDTMIQAIERGGSIDDAIRVSGNWMPSSDQLLISAAATAGRLPRALQVLSDRHSRVGAAKMRTLIACAYPAAVLHLGLLLLPVIRMIDWEKGFAWNPAAYARGLLCTLVPLWLLIAVLWSLARRGSPAVSRIFELIPIVGTYVRAQALSEFSFALGNFLDAGVPIDKAWAAAGLVSRSPRLKAASEDIRRVISRGERPGRRLSDWRCFPPDFVALYRTGETAGQLEQNLFRLATQFEQQSARALSLATKIYPAALFLVVAAGVAYFVISIYAGYLKMLTDLAKS
jgi:general secretion pathway protein F/type IV pilus assembly protein PilC